MPRKYPKKLTATAYHEAGHAAAAIYLRRRFRKVTIQAEEDSLGHILYGAEHARLLERLEGQPNGNILNIRTDNLSPFLRSAVERYCIISFAGMLAEKRLTGRFNHQGAASDRTHVDDMACLMFGSGKAATAYQNYLLSASEELVGNAGIWANITAIAQALLERTTLTEDETNKVIQNAFKSQR